MSWIRTAKGTDNLSLITMSYDSTLPKTMVGLEEGRVYGKNVGDSVFLSSSESVSVRANNRMVENLLITVLK